MGEKEDTRRLRSKVAGWSLEGIGSQERPLCCASNMCARGPRRNREFLEGPLRLAQWLPFAD